MRWPVKKHQTIVAQEFNYPLSKPQEEGNSINQMPEAASQVSFPTTKIRTQNFPHPLNKI